MPGDEVIQPSSSVPEAELPSDPTEPTIATEPSVPLDPPTEETVPTNPTDIEIPGVSDPSTPTTPTEAPSEAPSVAPSEAPTEAPSVAPSEPDEPTGCDDEEIYEEIVDEEEPELPIIGGNAISDETITASASAVSTASTLNAQAPAAQQQTSNDSFVVRLASSILGKFAGKQQKQSGISYNA